MASVLIVHASRHGGTRGIAERIAHVIEARGHDVELVSAASGPSVSGRDAVIVGSGVYMGAWLDDGIEFLRANAGVLSSRRVWLFSSGPLPASTTHDPARDPVEAALGPSEGPGSGGRRKLQELMDTISPREHRVFAGAFDPDDPPKAMAERLLRLMPASRNILPPGDYRDWPAIEAWAEEIAEQLPAPALAR
jgi:menaquinone-dependent protoporphyrinogen oxidase